VPDNLVVVKISGDAAIIHGGIDEYSVGIAIFTVFCGGIAGVEDGEGFAVGGTFARNPA
jgi:hypothetical protein